jgi:hypothetical protein
LYIFKNIIFNKYQKTFRIKILKFTVYPTQPYTKRGVKIILKKGGWEPKNTPFAKNIPTPPRNIPHASLAISPTLPRGIPHA